MTSAILDFDGIANKTAYNPTVPFVHEGRRYMGVRVESLESELDSQTRFAYEQLGKSNKWRFDDNIPALPLQDPSYVTINGKIILVGVNIQPASNGIAYRTWFYQSDSVRDLEFFTSGPSGMKDIRLVDLRDRIGVFTRPNGEIGYLEVGSVDELRRFSEGDWYSARTIDGLFDDTYWGGVNQALRLPHGGIGVIGHVANNTGNGNGLQKNYRTMSFTFDPRTKTHDGLRIIATRDDFPPSPSKKSPESDNVIFPAGIDDSGTLYCGLSDFCVGSRKIPNPFTV